MPIWISAIGRLLGTIALFYTVYSASVDIRSFIDTLWGPKLQHQLGIIAIFYMSSELFFSALFHKQRVSTACAELTAEVRSLRATNDDLTKQLAATGDAGLRQIGGSDFERVLTAYISDLAAKGRHRHILRLHGTLSRYLWVEGLLKARTALGEATDAAAANTGDIEAQLGALIDDLGWTYVALKDYSKATAKIEYGQHLARQSVRPYWISKADRHLAGMYTIRRQFSEATSHLTMAEQDAANIADPKEKVEMLAGIEYARAVVELMRGEYDEAMKHVEQSDRLRLKGGDETRVVRSYALRGKILLGKRDAVSVGQAKAQFRLGLSKATELGRRDEIIRNLNGLARVADMEGDRLQAEHHRANAKELSKDTPVPYEVEDQD